jgi:hypothetical protein
MELVKEPIELLTELETSFDAALVSLREPGDVASLASFTEREGLKNDEADILMLLGLASITDGKLILEGDGNELRRMRAISDGERHIIIQRSRISVTAEEHMITYSAICISRVEFKNCNKAS